ncbi:MAG: PQQ-binding-like beta-propeller repeat protein [Candidatus Bathyarchaeota archaeon]|nr:PQQ-binding-like beta-propeller repeat protein [Candidatus Termiticorpusculum sp.]
MKYVKSKNLFSMIAVLLMISFLVSIFALPNANAQTAGDRQIIAWPFVDAIPKTAGVGQPVLINWGLLNYLFTYTDGWNVTLQIIYPNGKVENHTGKTWSTGTVGRKMSFAEPGNYTLRCIFDGETYKWTTGTAPNFVINGGYYKPAVSENVTLQILEGYWKADHPGHTLPDEYWTRPVDSQLREWYLIMGSWVAAPPNLNARWNDAPESAHILWRMPIGDTMGGLSGGDTGPVGFQNGDAYEGKFTGSVILAGVLYYNRYVSNSPRQTVVAVDLHTGKIVWEKDFNFGATGANRVSRGQILNFITENNRGSWAYLWFVNGTSMYGVDAKTGDLKYNMTNVPGGTIYIGPNGEMLKYAVTNIGTTDNPNWRLTRWNSTWVVNRVSLESSTSGTADAWGSQIQGRTFDASRGYDINVSIYGLTTSPGNIIAVFPDDRIILAPGASATNGLFLTGVSLDPENLGYLLFNRRQFPAPAEWADLTMTTQTRWAAFSNDPYVGVFWTKENRKNYAFSLETGRFIWEAESHGYADAWTNAGLQGYIVDGKLYEASISGVVYCYDAATGEVLWTYEATDKYNESYHGENWWLTITFISAGKVYLGHMVHSPTVPITRGAPFFALDAETGEVVWEIDGAFRQTLWGGRALIGDSIIVSMDMYDQQIYAIGKGPSELTVSVSNAIIAEGNTVMISGTVMDVSPGTESDNLRYRFPNGVPAVGDESQSEWMLYLYKQFSEPMNVKGIEITLYAYDGEAVIDIGKTTSDSRGTYSMKWTPPKEGDYDIWAYFEGTAAFFGDDAKTTMAVLEAPTPEPVDNIPYGMYITLAAIAIIITIIVSVAIVGLLLLRKINAKA